MTGSRNRDLKFLEAASRSLQYEALPFVLEPELTDNARFVSRVSHIPTIRFGR
jgi:hypothetical protein